MLTLGKSVKIIIRSTVLRCDVIAPVVTTQLIHRFHTGSTFINDLHKVIVTIGLDGDAYLDAVADAKGRVNSEK